MRYLKIYVNGYLTQSIGCTKLRIARELDDYMDNKYFINHIYEKHGLYITDKYIKNNRSNSHNFEKNTTDDIKNPQIVIYECSKSKSLKIPRIHKIYMIYSNYTFSHIKHTIITVNSDATSLNYPSEAFDRSVQEIINFYTKNNKGIVSIFN